MAELTRAATNGAMRGHLAMLAFSGLVAGSFSLGAQVAGEIAPEAITGIRFLLAAAILGAWAAASGGLSRAAFAAPWRYAILGGLFAIYFVTMFEGLKTAAPVAAAAVFTLTPVMSAAFGWLLLRQATTPRMALALAVGGAGALWVIFDADPAALAAFRIGQGEAIYFVGCVAHALYTPLVPRLNRGEPPVVFSFGMLLGACAVVALWGAGEIAATDWAGLRPLVLVTIVYITLAASVATFVLLQYASLRLPAAKVMAYTYLTPSWVILWEAGIGGALPPAAVLAGVAATILALLLLLKA